MIPVALTEKLDRYPMSISELLPSGVGKYRTAFLYGRKALSRRHPRWRCLYLQQVLVQGPGEAGLIGPRSRGGGGAARRAWPVDLDQPRPFHDDPIALGISALHRVAAGLVVGPDDVLDVGVGNE